MCQHDAEGVTRSPVDVTGGTLVVVVDAHQHFWDPGRISYPWLAQYYPELDRNFTFADLAPHLAASGVDATVLVQSADDLRDDELMFEIAGAHPEIAGIVAWVPVEDAARTDELLERFASEPVVGVRTLIHNQPDPDWVLQPSVGEGLDVLAARRLPFDFVAVVSRHLEHVPVLCERHPDLRIVIDHLAKPPIGGAGFAAWSDLLARAAESPNVFAKVSGLYPAAGDRDPWTVEDLRPAFERALETFGPSRLMFGSDWPICEVAGGYETVAGALFELFGELEDSARADLMGETAVRCYGLDIKG